MVGLATAGILGGATATGIILVTSGPLSDTGPSAAPTAAAGDASVTANPSATSVANDAKLDVAERFDPATLPPVDTKEWVAYAGPRGELTVRAPASWTVTTREQHDYLGEKVIGDYAKVLKVANLPATPGEFSPSPGDVWADIRTETALVTYSVGRDDSGMFHQVRFVRSISGRDAEIIGTQFRDGVGLDPGIGALTLFVSAPSPRGGYLVAAVHVALPADLKTLAEAMALLTGIALK
ncbi:MAG: hypothetical protein HY875_10045 [Chloroflexi bacterium]|nr:hypothetical protein [Chloroflexota bacterium]